MPDYRKKLIEVALPLEAINREAAREKSIRHGHPSTLHLWWARRPLAACRAVLFASLIDDPDQEGVPQALLDRIDRLPRPEGHALDWGTLTLAEQRRQRLFGFIEQLVKWDNSTNEGILNTAHELILAATDGHPPPVLDPFCGGGSIPLEAQRLGLEAHASDLNPVAVLITRALIEIPPKFANQPPVNPVDRQRGAGAAWKGAAGLAADVRYYGKWMRDEAEKRIGHLYPKVTLPKEQGGGEATVIAWLWARTVTCPNPACGARMPLVRSFWLSTKVGRKAWVEPLVDRAAKTVQFEVCTGQGQPHAGTVDRRGATCLVCESPMPLAHVRAEGKAGRMGQQMMAIVAEGVRARVYVEPNPEQEAIAASARPRWKPEERVPTPSHDVDRLPMYGMNTWGDAFTPRQLVALTTFSDLVGEVREKARHDAVAAGMADASGSPEVGGIGAEGYSEAVGTYLAFAVSKMTEYNCGFVRWYTKEDRVIGAFARQAIPMTWDFVEINPNTEFGGSMDATSLIVANVLSKLDLHSQRSGIGQLDATAPPSVSSGRSLVCTDPPYYDNIGYADLSDFFYVWLRRSLRDVYPDLFGTLLTPKAPELIASPYRFDGSKQKARQFFQTGLGRAFAAMHAAQVAEYPLTLYYALKQSESEGASEIGVDSVGLLVASTGWESMLDALLSAGFAINGTWPLRSELGNRMIAAGTNALASSIVLVCRPLPDGAPTATRREFVSALKQELPDALRKLQAGNIAPVDLAQAAIGPGMAVFSRYSQVVDASGHPLSVRQALQIINQGLDEVLSEQEGEYDPETRWAITWFEQHAFDEGPFGDAEQLSKARNVGIDGIVEAGIVQARGGRVRLLRREDLPPSWDPLTDKRLTVWETTQQLIRALEAGGEPAAGALLAKIVAARSELGEAARDLAYRLYQTCERKKWSGEATAYNGLVVSWPGIQAHASSSETVLQGQML